MAKKKQSAEEKGEVAYLEMQAGVGITKHMGGPRATEELIRLCRIDKGKYVLDIGCGNGRTACLLTKKYGCRAVGVDVTPSMIYGGQIKGRRAGLKTAVGFFWALARFNMQWNPATSIESAKGVRARASRRLAIPPLHTILPR